MVWSRFALVSLSLFLSLELSAALSIGDVANSLKSFDGMPKLRVRVAKALERIRVSGTDLSRFIHVTKNEKTFNGKKSVSFECGRVASTKGPMLLASLDSATGLVTVDKGSKTGKYLGQIHISTSTDLKHCDVINEIDMESYLSTLLAKEMNSTWPVEALKAQAIAARTYALHKVYSKEVSKLYGSEVFFDLESSEKHQVSGGFQDETRETREAATGTAGEVLVNTKGELTPIFFHAKCGGQTRLPEQVWQNSVTGYSSVKCPYCHDYGKPGWSAELSTERLEKFINWSVDKGYFHPKRKPQKGELIKVVDDRWSQTRVRVSYGDQSYLMEKSVFRRYLGRVEMRSNNFHVRNALNGDLVLEGNGHGHGVGLCQMGALEMAKRGMTHKQILAHYFPQMRLMKVY